MMTDDNYSLFSLLYVILFSLHFFYYVDFVKQKYKHIMAGLYYADNRRRE